MLYPLIIKRILHRIRISYENLLILKEDTRYYNKYEAWLNEYFNLDNADHENIIKKFERSQTTSIIEAMRRCDREIFINQLGVFFIKPTTIDYYNSLNRIIGDKDKTEYDMEEVRKQALAECKEAYIKRFNLNKYVNETKDICIKI